MLALVNAVIRIIIARVHCEGIIRSLIAKIMYSAEPFHFAIALQLKNVCFVCNLYLETKYD